MLFRFVIVRSSRTEELEVSGEVGVEGLHFLQLQLWLYAAKSLCPLFLSNGFEAVFWPFMFEMFTVSYFMVPYD